MESFFAINNFKSRKKLIKSFFSVLKTLFNIKIFKSRKKVMKSFSSINNFKSCKEYIYIYIYICNYDFICTPETFILKVGMSRVTSSNQYVSSSNHHVTTKKIKITANPLIPEKFGPKKEIYF